MISDAVIMSETLARFEKEFTVKFKAGEKKYTTPLIKKDLLRNASEEVLDLAAYITAARMREQKLREVIDDWRAGMPAEMAMQQIFDLFTFKPNGRID